MQRNDLDYYLHRHIEQRKAGRPTLGVVCTSTTDALAACRRVHGDVLVWHESCLASTPDLESQLLGLVLSEWWPALERGAWRRLANHVGSTPSALQQRCSEIGIAAIDALFARVTLDGADTLAREVVASSSAHREDVVLRRFERLGVVDTWVELARLQTPPPIVVELSGGDAQSWPGLRMLVRLVESVPAWSVLLVSELPTLVESLQEEPETHEKALLRAGLIPCDSTTSIAVPERPAPSASSQAAFWPAKVEEAREALEALNLPSEREVERSETGERLELPPEASLARSKAELALFWMLEQHPETHALFRLNVLMPFCFGPRRAELDLYSEQLALCIEVDGPHHFLGAFAYRRDRRKDALLQRNEIWLIRVLAEDVVNRREEVLDFVLETVRARRRNR
jgi:hypothetical protein